jgi:hypothetical protein
MRGLAEGAAKDLPPETKKSPSQGVDVPEKDCMMCGSVGHFGDDQKGSGAEAVPDDL